uniref:Uncharacterized protein n=1 Tax=Anopheles coluzzii TaxID=1518534 RepID=A0A8W7PVM3_ANOCL
MTSSFLHIAPVRGRSTLKAEAARCMIERPPVLHELENGPIRMPKWDVLVYARARETRDLGTLPPRLLETKRSKKKKYRATSGAHMPHRLAALLLLLLCCSGSDPGF